jgi:hypothetical protein
MSGNRSGTVKVAIRMAATRAAAANPMVTFVVGLIALAFVIALLALAVSIGVGMGSASNATYGEGDQPSDYAREIIPADMLDLYRSASVKQECPGLSWTVVAAIIHLESNDNRNPGLSSAGAMGASQFMPGTWNNQGSLAPRVGPFGRIPQSQGYAMDGDGDGIADILNPRDSVPATARMLCANGGDKPTTLPNAVYAYNHAWWYVHGGTDDYGNKFLGVLPLAEKLSEPLPVGGTVGGWTKPIQSYTMSAPFGQCGYLWSNCHTGQDFAAPVGTPVMAATGGKIITAGWTSDTWAGIHVVIQLADGTELWYCHLSGATVSGGYVAPGTLLGYVGATGNVTGAHLHFEVRNPSGTPIDPMPFLRGHGVNM